jgi:hypothetical protein
MSNRNATVTTFVEHEKDPRFRQRAAVLEPKLRAAIARDETLVLGEIAAELGVSLYVAGVWIALLAARMGERLQITVGGLS